jgi:hypothetical protein
MKNLEWDECLCKCYITHSKYAKSWEWVECSCKCYITQSKYEKSWARGMFM